MARVLVVLTKPCATCGRWFIKGPEISRADWPSRLYCKRACQYAAMRGRPNPRIAAIRRGVQFSVETRAKLSESMKRRHAEGRAHVIDNMGRQRESTSQWKGDNVLYRAAHARLYSQRGRPERCDLCGTTTGRIEWALKNDAQVVKVEVEGPNAGRRYSTRPDDYFPVCSGCHIVYDERRRTATGQFI